MIRGQLVKRVSSAADYNHVQLAVNLSHHDRPCFMDVGWPKLEPPPTISYPENLCSWLLVGKVGRRNSCRLAISWSTTVRRRFS